MNNPSPQKQLSPELTLSANNIYGAAFEFAPNGMAIVKDTGEFLFANLQLLKILNYQMEELLNINLNDLTYPHDPDFITNICKKLKSTKIDNLREERQILHKDHSIIWIALSASLITLDDTDCLIIQVEDISLKKRDEQDIQASEKKYRNLVENMLDGLYQATIDGNFLTVNPALVKMLGYDSVEELLQINIAKDLYMNPSDRNDWIREIEQKKQLQNVEITLKRKDGSTIEVLDNSRSVFNEKGEFLYFEGILTDITAFKKATQQHKQSEANLRAVIENTQDSIWSIDRDYKILAINSIFQKAFKHNYGITLVKGTSVLDELDPIKRMEWKTYYDRALRGEPFITNESYEVLGEKRSVELSFNPIISDSGQITGVAVYVHDITSFRTAIEELEESKEMFRLLFENAPVGIISIDIEGNILEINNKLIEIAGAPDRNSVKKINIFKFPQLIKSGITADLQKCIDESKPIFRERPYITPWGKETHLHYCFAPIINKDGKIISIQGIIEDISERKKATDQLFESYKYLGVINRKLGILLNVGKNQETRQGNEITEFILESAQELSNASNVTIYKYNQSFNKIRLIKSTDKELDENSELGQLLVEKSPFLQKIIHDQIRVQKNDIEEDFNLLSKSNQDINYVLGIPLVHDKVTIGAIFLFFEDGRELTTQELDFYEVFAMQAANALSNAQIL